MKFFTALILLFPLQSFAADGLTVFKCDYRIAHKDGKIFEMSGNIVADDVAGQPSPYRITYLTLAPNELSGDTTEARVLITSDGYNPITLHKAGQSAATLAYTELKAEGGELGYTSESGTSYRVECKRR